jgi:hypothetical protein
VNCVVVVVVTAETGIPPAELVAPQRGAAGYALAKFTTQFVVAVVPVVTVATLSVPVTAEPVLPQALMVGAAPT